jgi:hypothetical protein
MLHQINSSEENMRCLKTVLDRKVQDNSEYLLAEYKKYSANFTLAVAEFRTFLSSNKVSDIN